LFYLITVLVCFVIFATCLVNKDLYNAKLPNTVLLSSRSPHCTPCLKKRSIGLE